MGAGVALFTGVIGWAGRQMASIIAQTQINADLITATVARIERHEDICQERYKRIEEAHVQMRDVNNERHTETRERLDSIDENLMLVLAKLR